MKGDYIEQINTNLIPKEPTEGRYHVLDLFAGCGGLSLGFEAVGFTTVGYEMNEDAVATYNRNLNGTCYAELLTPDFEFPNAQVIIGGPPCQPFSVGGKQLGLKDSRDGFPIFISAVKNVKPDFFLFENVRGLLYKNRWYFNEIVAELESMGYKISFELLNAKYYNVPQNRERVIVAGYRGKKRFSFPERSKQLITAGEAIAELAVQFDENSKFFTESMDTYVAKYEKASKCINPRDLYMDRPARTLTCRNLAGATGDMHRVRLPDNRRRRITVREAARLQSFPDWFEFSGVETSQFNQIGNAVAPNFAYALANGVMQFLENPNGYKGHIPTQLKLEYDR